MVASCSDLVESAVAKLHADEDEEVHVRPSVHGASVCASTTSMGRAEISFCGITVGTNHSDAWC